VQITSRHHKEPVILWGDDFCSWIGILDELGLEPVAVILSSSASLALARGSVGNNCFVGLAADFQESLLPSMHGQCRLGLVNGRITQGLCGLGAQLDLKCLIGTTCVRQNIPAWQHDSLYL
jgi:hypothetical protein